MAMLLIYAVGADQECDLFAQIAPHVAADEGGNLATLLSRALKSGIDARNRWPSGKAKPEHYSRIATPRRNSSMYSILTISLRSPKHLPTATSEFNGGRSRDRADRDARVRAG